ncbi:glycoside hydrolase family 43 protein [Lentilactobacillus sp. Marseille-Q4993]|uniref:glycoside hydrolase family 43 protein n=1 Tax=Lentilactobacillus sp. Marseille-Q4993 TaxID=3039492 RepID=UPI0024BC5FEB|nr:glycoside hydrolase family 43 protein [Lentilactobacillus sp. Marseille-Q4993]
MNTKSSYLFVYFAGEKYENGEQIYMATSDDGLFWQDLNNNQPILTSTIGTGGVRDPFITYNPLTQKYVIIATDLRMHGHNNWAEVQRTGSRNLIVWESTNLIDWNGPRSVEVAPESFGCVWAAEASYDQQKKAFNVYWASKINGDDFTKQRIYLSTTADFINFTKPEVWIDNNFSTIDTTIAPTKDGYYRISKNETTTRLFIEHLLSFNGEPRLILSPYLSNLPNVEGPISYQLPSGEWCLLADNFTDKGYFPLITSSLGSGEFHQLNEDEFKMPSRARHGSVIKISTNEKEALIKFFNKK